MTPSAPTPARPSALTVDYVPGGAPIVLRDHRNDPVAVIYVPNPKREQAALATARRMARAEQMEAALEDIVRFGLRCDLMPTNGHARDWKWWQNYLTLADQHIRSRARTALAASRPDGEADGDG